LVDSDRIAGDSQNEFRHPGGISSMFVGHQMMPREKLIELIRKKETYEDMMQVSDLNKR
jgi:hypothetical protein